MSSKQPKHKSSKTSSLQPRPPIVVVLGHVDHGKTSILDYIRKSRVTEKETGGITQHIGAYQIKHPSAGSPRTELPRTEEPRDEVGAKAGQASKLITFIDTPGHEAFSAMRSRGAKVADLAILVVAVDEGVKPQTKEAISHIQKAGLSLIVALNKIDKPGAIPEKAKKQLAENKIIVEELGGQIPCVETSAKTGQGIDDLLDLINLLAEMEEIAADQKKPARGVIIESYLDSKRGPTATILVKEGTLKKQDIIVTESTYGPIKIMEDFQGKSIPKAPPSTPVQVVGLTEVPTIGEKWTIGDSLIEARKRASKKAAIESPKRKPAEILEITPEKKVFNFIIKADVSGSLEAIRESLSTIPQDKVVLRILTAAVGDINESDIKLAQSAKAWIFGFRVKLPDDIAQIAKRLNIKINIYQVIYELIQGIREAASQLLGPEIIRHPLGKVEILATFKSSDKNQIVGGKVVEGKIKHPAFIDILRNEKVVGQGKLLQLQMNKKDVATVPTGKECGILFVGKAKIELGDILEVYEEERKKQEL